jgi:hypothetical protein
MLLGMTKTADNWTKIGTAVRELAGKLRLANGKIQNGKAATASQPVGQTGSSGVGIHPLGRAANCAACGDRTST